MATLITYPGNVATDRWLLTLTPSAATIKVRNAAETEPPLVLVGVSASVVVVSGYSHDVFADSVEAYHLLAPGSGWFFLQPGGNNITITGATGTLRYNATYL